MKFNSITEIIQQSIRSSFEKIMLDEIEKIEAKAIQEIKLKFENQRKEVKHHANKMAIEILHKSDINGFTLEIKT